MIKRSRVDKDLSMRESKKRFFFVVFLSAILLNIKVNGQESITASFSLESNILYITVLDVQGVGHYKTKLNLVENSRFKPIFSEQSDLAKAEYIFQTATSTMILPIVSVLQGDVIVSRY